MKENITGIKNFRYWFQSIIPLSYEESLSQYELMCKLLHFLNETVIPHINILSEEYNKLYDLVITLQNYINHYFDNLDVQEEINNKLDEMAKNGELESIIEKFVTSSIDIHFPKLTSSNDSNYECVLFKFKLSGQEKNAILDFGRPENYNEIINNMLSNNITKIDYAFISHFHSDHVGSLVNIINDNRLDFTKCVFYIPPVVDYSKFINSARYVPNLEMECMNAISSKDIEYKRLNTFDKIKVNVDTEISFYNVNTSAYTEYYNTLVDYGDVGMATNYNNFSVVMEINHKNINMLFTGDIMKKAQEIIIKQGIKSYDFIKVEHHGWNPLQENDPTWLYKYAKVNKSVVQRNEENAGFRTIILKDYNLYSTNDGNIKMISSGYNLNVIANGKEDPIINVGRYLESKNLNGILHTGVPYNNKYLKENDDLNDYTTPDTYISTEAPVTNTLLNCPFKDNSFKLIIMNIANDNRFIQFIIQNFSHNIYMRHGERNNNIITWSNWNIDYSLGSIQSIKNGTDLNDLSIGCLKSGSTDTTKTLLNIPSDLTSGFKIITEVTTSDTDYFRLHQTIIENTNDSVIYKRTFSTNGWSSWSKISKPMNLNRNIGIKNIDLNSLLDPGVYAAKVTADSSTILNKPNGINGGFRLVVTEITSNDRLMQEIWSNENPINHYIRYYNGSWSPWHKYTTTQVV